MARPGGWLEPISGEKLYQVRARAAFPRLVQFAESRRATTYTLLSRELGMKNPRNLDYVLGAVGESLERLGASKAWRLPAPPPLQFLVVNKNTGLPGSGIDSFHPGFSSFPDWRKREVVEREQAGVFHYPHWRDVLQTMGMAPLSGTPALVGVARHWRGGEGPEHAALKAWICTQAALFSLPSEILGLPEISLSSGDRPDVTFVHRRTVLAVEVKPAQAPEADIARGIFQCVKYKAVLDAEAAVQGTRRAARVVLALGGRLTPATRTAAALLGIEVMEVVGPA